MRISCVLWGCWCDENNACPKCGSALYYDADFVQIGKLQWLFEVRDFFRGKYSLVTRRCDVCRKRMWWTRHDPCCSDECFDKWIPF
jgi:hypothetical protein